MIQREKYRYKERWGLRLRRRPIALYVFVKINGKEDNFVIIFLPKRRPYRNVKWFSHFGKHYGSSLI